MPNFSGEVNNGKGEVAISAREHIFPKNIPVARVIGLLLPACIALISGTVVIGRALVQRSDPWLLGDWLIDYSAGFSRRGLVGEAVRYFSELTGADRIVITIGVVWITFVALIAVVTLLFLQHRRALTTLLLFVSPAFLLYFLNFLGSMRKELLVLLLVSAVLLATRNSPRGRWGWVLVGGFPLLVFAHEGLALFVGFVLIVIALLTTEGATSKREATAQAIVLVLSTVLAGVATFLFGSRPGIDAEICNNLRADGYSSQLCGGAIAFLDRDSQEAIDRVAALVATENYLTTYGLVFLLAAVPFSFVRFSKILSLGVVVALAATVPLFVVAIDWGRWIVISVWLLTLIVVRFDGNKHIRILPLSPKTFAADLIAVLAIIAFAFSWSVPHCCEPRIGFGLIDRVTELLRFAGLG